MQKLAKTKADPKWVLPTALRWPEGRPCCCPDCLSEPGAQPLRARFLLLLGWLACRERPAREQERVQFVIPLDMETWELWKQVGRDCWLS